MSGAWAGRTERRGFLRGVPGQRAWEPRVEGRVLGRWREGFMSC